MLNKKIADKIREWQLKQPITQNYEYEQWNVDYDIADQIEEHGQKYVSVSFDKDGRPEFCLTMHLIMKKHLGW